MSKWFTNILILIVIFFNRVIRLSSNILVNPSLAVYHNLMISVW